MASDASHVLEAALEQMDEIIAGSQAAERRPLLVPQLAEQLRLAVEEKNAIDTQGNVQTPVSNEGYQERLSRLEGDKESLVLQVSVLTDQVEAQGEKIRDLESNLEEHQHKLDSTEEMLQQELLRRTSLETQKLDLMDEVSYLKLKLVGMEEQQQGNREDKQQKAECVVNLISELQEQMCKFQQEISTRIQEKQALEGQAGRNAKGPHAWSVQGPCSAPAEDPRQNKGENGLLQELRHLKSKVDELEGEKCQYERKLKSTKAEISNLQQLLAAKDAEIEGLQKKLLSQVPASDDNAERDQELLRLRVGMEALLAANEEKDRRILELSALLEQYRKIKDVMGLAQATEKLPGGSEEDLSRSGGLRGLTHRASMEILRLEVSSRGSSPLVASPSSLESRSTQVSPGSGVSPGSAVSPGNTSYQNGQWTKTRMLSSSLEELQCGPVQLVAGEPVDCISPEVFPLDDVTVTFNPTLKAIRHPENSKFQTLPGKRWLAAQNGSRETPSPAAPRDNGDLILRKTEARASPDISASSSGVDSGQNSPVSPEHRKNQKGIKKFWGKIRRTQSGSLQRDELEPSAFRRGGLRATAGPRLARTPDSGSSIRDKNTPFAKWTKEQVCGWLEDEGLGQYVSLTRQWVASGQTLLAASAQDIEKEMGIKHPLHRKKIQLAVRSFSSKVPEKSAELDHVWVTRWLDDIGLPQYKDQFNEARVDGRMLQYLTLSDLLFLKVTSQLHHLSIKSAIHVLHINKFNPNCLRRRPGDESKMSPSEVIQWSNHRVMEWLRSVDLAEYAANLRGSGVHGGLLILEPRFNSETLAMLLNIPTQKTLLRRHLATNFTTLVGPQAQLEKRQCMGASGYTPLTTTAKVRPKKLGFSTFGHLRKKKLDDSTDYICPADMSPVAPNGPVLPYAGLRGLSPIFDRDGERLEQAGRKS